MVRALNGQLKQAHLWKTAQLWTFMAICTGKHGHMFSSEISGTISDLYWWWRCHYPCAHYHDKRPAKWNCKNVTSSFFLFA